MKKLISLVLTTSLTFSFTSVFASEMNFETLEQNFNVNEIFISEDQSIVDFNNEAYVIENYTPGDYKMGMFDYSNNEIVPTDYYYLDLFYEDLAVTQKYINAKTGFIDRAGNWAIAPQFDSADRFNNGLALIYKDGRNAYIDKTGKAVFLLDENQIASRFNNNKAIIYTEDEITIINNNFETIATFPNNAFWVDNFEIDRFILWEYDEETSDSYIKVMDSKGTVYFSVKNGMIDNFIDNKALVTLENTIQLIDSMGNIISEKAIDDNYSQFLRVCENINIENKYSDIGESIVNIYNDKFEKIASFNGYNAGSDTTTKSIILYPENPEDPHYFLLNKNTKVPEKVETNYTDYQEFMELPDPSLMVLKINNPKVFVNDEMRFLEWEIDRNNLTQPFILNGRTMVPVRFISENFGLNNYHVDYINSSNEKIILLSGEKQIKLVVGKKTATVTEYNEELNDYISYTVELDVEPMIVNDRTFVPIRFVSETIGLNVEWDERGYVIIGDKLLIPDNLDNLFNAQFEISDYPIIDGSTATIPISVALTKTLLNVSEMSANSITNHTKTENSFKNLLQGNADLLITGTPNDNKRQRAKESGMELEHYAFAKDAFIFIVNKDNPVDTLTPEQIKKIYSGEITNWKEVGGNDAEIIAYQRNEDSGSQNLMKKFMGNTPLMQPKFETINAMGEMIDVLAEYDNNINSIGYTVNYYMSEMHFSDNVKVIKLDGIEANEDNIRSNIYPQVLEYALVFDKSEPANSPIRAIVEFLKTEKGITLIKEQNFVSTK